MDSKRVRVRGEREGVWWGLEVEAADGRVDEMKKRRGMVFVVGDEAQHWVMSVGWTFRLVSAERRCIEGEGGIFEAFGALRVVWLEDRSMFGCARLELSMLCL